jgi:hypothetical protein
LAVDIIRAIQEWHLESRSVPDVRDSSVDRGRTTKGFSAVEEDRKRGHENAETGATDESMNQSFEHSDVPAAAVENGVNGEEKE